MTEEIESLADVRWKHRLILGFMHDPTPALAAFSAHDEGLQERDLLYFLRSASARHTNSSDVPSEEFWQQVSQLSAAPGFLLIGRDGGVKARYESLDLGTVFALIDTMPMRIQEMQDQDNY